MKSVINVNKPVCTWIDHLGRSWPIIQSLRRLKFKYPAHAALRAYVFNRDGYKCKRCEAMAVGVNGNYDGSEALNTDTFLKNGYRDVLVVDHIRTLKAGGLNVVENLQALCETCNKRKQIEDKSAVAKYSVVA